MFYQPDATAQEMLAYQEVIQLEIRLGGPANSSQNPTAQLDQETFDLIQSAKGKLDRYKEDSVQAALVTMRNVVLCCYPDKVDAQVHRAYYVIARYYQEVFGWKSLNDCERAAVSPMLEALLERLCDSRKPQASTSQSVPLSDTAQMLLEHVADLPLASRLVAAHFHFVRQVRQGHPTYTFKSYPVTDMRDLCGGCLKKSAKLKRCGRCKVAFYCSSACQARDWTVDHKTACPVYAKHAGDAIGRAEERRKLATEE